MSDKLKDFVQNNRAGFDDLDPSDLWSSIDTEIKQQTSGFKIKKISNMFKYGFGASALVVGTMFLINTQREKTNTLIQTQNTTIDSPLAVFKIPKVNNGAVLLTEFTNKATNEGDALQTPKIVETQNPEPSTTLLPEDIRQERFALSNPGDETTKTSPVSVEKNDDSLSSPGYKLIDTIFKGIKRVEVKGEFCKVNVKAYSEDHVSFQGHIGTGSGDALMVGTKVYRRKDDRIKFERIGDVLKVWIEHGELVKKALIVGERKDESVLNFSVPVKTNLGIQNSSGDISVNGVENVHLDLRTYFGDIHVENIKSDLTLKSTSGNISATNITGELRTESSFGNQLIVDVTGDIKLRSTSGGITVKQLKGNADVCSSFGYQKYESVTGNIICIASSGDLTIKDLRGNAYAKSSFGKQEYVNVEGDIRSHASSGDIKINDSKGVLALGTSFGDITGKNVRLLSDSEFKTSSGDIKLNLLNEMKELSFDLQTSSGDLVVEKDNQKSCSEKKLMMGKGNIRIKGVTSFGDQSYK